MKTKIFQKYIETKISKEKLATVGKKVLTTSERLRASMTPQELKKHEEGYRDFLMAELKIATNNQNEVAACKLAKAIEASLKDS